ncbi:phosphotransferase family protein [Reyranella sp. CPCC 100927]|uniref:phosphotransferase family protein n=1 Tax=Reyranella sp. CPCC 100927 TaxID=2599616 RepID=UPI0011B3AEF6|nr:phosphotransferase [Reyranella sp. CPCC 100927]TWT15575.1 phosphotransferase [Reyranella sp. CPCC 100927]
MIASSAIPDVEKLATLIGTSRRGAPTVIETGQNNRVFDFGDMIVRVPRHAAAQAALCREAQLLERLRVQLPIAVPAVAIRDVDGLKLAVHRRLPGQPIESAADLGAAEQASLARDLAHFLQHLHGLPLAVLGHDAAPPNPARTWHDLFQRVALSIFPRVSTVTARRIRYDFERFLGRIDDLPIVVIHGDFGTGNILVDGATVTGIIDFSGCDAGDPAYDFASLAAGLGKPFVRQLQPHYPDLSAMWNRLDFYMSTFALLDVLFGLDHDDDAALQAGLTAINSAPGGHR